jgi:hypothetical protein
MNAMLLTKLPTAAAVLLAVALFAGLGTGRAPRLGAAEQAAPGKRAGAPQEPASSPGKPEDVEGPLKKALVEEARKTYELDLARLKGGSGGVPPEDLYRWSRRWVKAQLDLAGTKEERLAALRDHVERMKDLEKMTKALADTGQGSTADATAGRFYRAQAELWLTRARAK